MQLTAAARAFDTMPCVDAYTGAHAFDGQLALYDDNKRDSVTTERRVISTAPDVTIPARRVVKAAGTQFIIGHGNPDWYRGSAIRMGYVAHEATDLAQVRTLAQACLDQAGFTAWAAREWIKSLAYSEQNSKLAPQYHIYFARTEPVLGQHLVTFGSGLHLVRTRHEGPSGTLVTLCDELAEPSIEMVSVAGTTWDPVAETMTGGPTSVRAVRARWQSLFGYRSNLAPKFGPDDMQVAFAKSALTARAGMRVTASDGAWVLQDALSEGDVWLCRATRHA